MQLNEVVIKLLNNRGVTTEEGIMEFLSDKPRLTHEPELMPDIEAGARLILDEIKNGGKICVYGDYDADGITATTLMISVLSHIAGPSQITHYIPSRFDEGYGLNIDAIDMIVRDKVTMILTVDCGSVSINEVEYAKSKGLKIIVTDHHNINEKMSDCLLINPKRPDSQYPFRELSGCGVAFKLAQVIQKMAGLGKNVLSEVLDLVAIGTIGDIMPLVDENRTLVKYGLKAINENTRAGLKGLIEGVGLKPGAITCENVGYVIVPHLNAAGRIEDASLSVMLLACADNKKKTECLVQNLLEKNLERKRLQNETYKRAIDIIGDQIPEFNAVWIDDAHEGIIGIVAGKLKEDFNRPTIIVTPIGGDKIKVKGTGRSIEGVDLHEIMNRHQDLFEKFGGHSGACGFTMPRENFDKLRCALIKDMIALEKENPDLFVRKTNYDMEIDFRDISLELAKQIGLLAPFGTKNTKPVFKVSGVKISNIRYMGNENQHVRFDISPEENSNEVGRVQCVLFNKAKKYSEVLRPDSSVNLYISIDCQTWQGQERLQLVVSEIEKK